MHGITNPRMLEGVWKQFFEFPIQNGHFIVSPSSHGSHIVISDFYYRHELTNVLFVCENCKTKSIEKFYKNYQTASIELDKKLSIIELASKKTDLIVIFNDTTK